jgi:hypothetical protein
MAPDDGSPFEELRGVLEINLPGQRPMQDSLFDNGQQLDADDEQRRGRSQNRTKTLYWQVGMG